MPVNEPVRNGNFINTLTQNLAHGVASISVVPGLVKKVIEDSMWSNFVVKSSGEEVRFDSFQQFVEAPLSKGGLETNIESLKNLCCKDNAARDLIDQAVQRGFGGDNNPYGRTGKSDDEINVDNINIDFVMRPTGTSKEQGLRRLRKDRMDLHQEVLDGKKSVHAACVEAGFRKRPSTTEVAKKAVQKMSKEELLEFRDWFLTHIMEDSNG